MNYIHWLEIAKTARHARHLSNHYILKLENKFMVFTTNPEKIPIKSAKIADTTIIGRKQTQYIVEKIHTVDPEIHIIKPFKEGLYYCTKYTTELQPWIEKMQIVIEKIT